MNEAWSKSAKNPPSNVFRAAGGVTSRQCSEVGAQPQRRLAVACARHPDDGDAMLDIHQAHRGHRDGGGTEKFDAAGFGHEFAATGELAAAANDVDTEAGAGPLENTGEPDEGSELGGAVSRLDAAGSDPALECGPRRCRTRPARRQQPPRSVREPRLAGRVPRAIPPSPPAVPPDRCTKDAAACMPVVYLTERGGESTRNRSRRLPEQRRNRPRSRPIVRPVTVRGLIGQTSW